MNVKALLPFFLVLIVLLQGCAFSRGTLGDELSANAIAALQKGQTTKAEVIHLLGAPDRLVQLNGRDVFQYYRYDAKAGSLLLIVLNFTRLSIKSDDLFVVLNKDGLVEDVISSNRTKGMKFRFWPFGE